MSAAPAPTNDDEARRLAVLHAIGVLGTPAEPSFDALADCAASASGCPVALLNLVDADRVWVKAAVGTPAASLPREQALCTHVVAADAPLEVDDLRRDARFAGHALVAVEGGLRFFAGFPLRVEGRAVGALCVHDRVPRRLDAAQRRTLASLAQAGSELLALRLKVGEVERERARLADFARASGDWMWETDAELRYTWISPTYEAVTGVPARQWLGRRIVDTPLLDAQGRPLPDGATLHALMARPEPYARVLTEQRIGERRLFVLRSAVPVFDAAGALGGWRGTSRDLTARMAVSERAREREDMLAKLAASLPGVVFQYRLHPDGRVSYPYVSSRVREVYGIEPPATGVLHEREQAVSMLLPEDRARFLASIDESARGLTRWVHDYRIVRADGEVRWLESRSIPEPLPDGGILWHGFTADVTERKAMELALRRTEERWELAAEAAGIGRATLDLASGTMEFDRRACLNHGLPWPHAPIAFTAWRDSIDPEQRDAVVRDLERAVTERRTFETRCRVRRPDGELRLIELVARAVVGADGAATSLVGTCRDVTGQAAAEQLRRDKESAERANRAKTEFLSRVSHELRTPLNSILGFAQLMSLDAQQPLPAGQRRRLDNVQQAGRHLLGLINDVLELTRIEQAEAALECGPVDALAALRSCLATLEPLALAGDVVVAPLQAAGDERWVRADPRALEQVLMNLLSNAIKYNRRGGTLTATLACRAGADGACVEIGVRDEGRGLSEAQQAALFQPFNRLGAERHRIEGTGLGLVIARELARAMRGELRVDSRPDSGSTFTLSLPAAPAPAALPATEAAPRPDHAAAPGRRRLLYIEDEPLNVLLVEEVVRTRAEWTLTVAGDGAGGIEQARTLAPDLVLVDMNLPDTNGIALIRALRTDPRTAALRCVALSADALPEQVEAARRAGFDDYWTKPIDVVRMLGRLSVLLAERAPR